MSRLSKKQARKFIVLLYLGIFTLVPVWFLAQPYWALLRDRNAAVPADCTYPNFKASGGLIAEDRTELFGTTVRTKHDYRVIGYRVNVFGDIDRRAMLEELLPEVVRRAEAVGKVDIYRTSIGVYGVSAW